MSVRSYSHHIRTDAGYLVNRMKHLRLIMAVAVVFGSLLFVRPSHAATMGDVLINEAVTQPSAGNLEWYELFNTTATAIDLTNWTIYRQVIGDSITLTGTLPAYGIIVFTAASTTVNDAGDAVVLYDASHSMISAVTYGNNSAWPAPHSAAPGIDQSASAAVNVATTPPTVTYTVGTPTKGWFNNATDFTCAQMAGTGTPTTPPTLSSLATCLLSQSGVSTNMGTQDNSSAAVSLYFEKSISGAPVGRITFTGPLNLTDSATVTYLKEIGQKMEAIATGGEVKVGLDTSVASAFSGVAGSIVMYNVPGTTAPSLVVYDNAGAVIAPTAANYPTISGGVFDATAHTYTFSASHFTSFKTKTFTPSVKALTMNKGSYSYKVGTKTIKITPFATTYKGAIWARKVNFGTDGVVYIFANQAKFAQGAIKAYNANGKLLGTYKPFKGDWAKLGLVLDAAVQSDKTVFLAVGGLKDQTSVRFFKVTNKGLTSVNTVTALSRAGQVIVKFSKIYGSDYGALTYLNGQKATLKVWKYNSTTKKFVQDKTYKTSKIKI